MTPPPDGPKGEIEATLLRGGTPHDTSKISSYAIVVALGPDAGMRCTIDVTDPARSLVGQSAACNLRLTDKLVSRRHAALDVTPRGLRLTDLRSTNGTFVGDTAVFDVLLQDGAHFRVGDTTLRVDANTVGGARQPASLQFGGVLGGSSAMRRIYPLCRRLAAADVPVVIEGETGTGKELLAEALHEQGPRSKGPFVVFDCTAIPPNLVESALFGHERGAFTGANATRRGVFEQANGGTLLIDEVGDLDIALQPKLLRAIERSEVQRLGGEKFIQVDVRVLAATRRDLDREVQAGRFRDDLFFRLAVARIELPPLRSREGDVALLGSYFWRELGGGDTPPPPDLLQRFEDYAWPGNVRELYNAVANRLALGDLAGMSKPAVCPPSGPATASLPFPTLTVRADLPFSLARQRILEDFERAYLERVLASHDGNVKRAATASGIARRYFHIIKARIV